MSILSMNDVTYLYHIRIDKQNTITEMLCVSNTETDVQAIGNNH